MKTFKKIYVLLLLASFISLFFLGAFAESFPEQDSFNGMQITYSILGVSIEGSEETHDFTTSRKLTGKVTGKKVSITATVKQDWGYGATISASCGSETYSKEIKVGESDSFSLSFPVTKDMASVSISIRMSGSYNAGSRGLEVFGTFENANYVPPKAGSETVVPNETNKDKVHITIDTNATDSAGERGVGVAAVVVVGLLGAGAAAAGAGASAQGSDSSAESGDGKNYKMYVYKDFGDSLRCGAPGVPVYARMAEVSAEGIENDRLDLTQQIEIFSGSSVINVRDQAPSGNYMGAFVEAESASGQSPKEGIVSFKFTGEGGTFQNNVSFRLVGECYIELEAQTLFVLSGSGNSFSLKYNLVDFTAEAEVKVSVMQDNLPFAIETGIDENNQTVIIATDDGEKRPIEKFFDTFSCEITAENDKESARTVFYTSVCHEGILPDFLGKPKEIRGYKKSDDSEEMEETLFYIKAGIWDAANKKLELVRPENVAISLEDEKNIFDLIGTNIINDTEKSSHDKLAYTAKADKCFPSSAPIDGTMTISGNYGDIPLENVVEIKLIPDIQKYEESFEKEYLACKRVIEVYMAEGLRAKKLRELEKAKNTLGLEDLKLFRKNCWSLAERCIMQEGRDYLNEEAWYEANWYDKAIAAAEILVYIGDVAFDIALAPIGGPITGFIAGQVKSGFLDLCQLYVEGSGDKSIWEITQDFVSARMVQALGSADGLIATPGLDKPASLVIWLGCYTIYRIGYHLAFSKDENGNSVGLSGALWKGFQDFTGKSAGALLGDFVKNNAKGTWAERISIADKDQKLVDDKVRGALKYGLDKMDVAAEKLDKSADEFVSILYTYLQKLKAGEYVSPTIR